MLKKLNYAGPAKLAIRSNVVVQLCVRVCVCGGGLSETLSPIFSFSFGNIITGTRVSANLPPPVFFLFQFERL